MGTRRSKWFGGIPFDAQHVVEDYENGDSGTLTTSQEIAVETHMIGGLRRRG